MSESMVSGLLSDMMECVEDIINGYEVRGDNGDYIPSGQEVFMIRDCIYGLLDDKDFIAKFKRWVNSSQTGNTNKNFPRFAI